MGMEDLIILLSIAESDASINKDNHNSKKRHHRGDDHGVYLKVLMRAC